LERFVAEKRRLASVNPVISYIDAPNHISLDVECGSQVPSNFHGMNCFAVDGRELVDFVRSQARIEWILLENPKGSRRQPLLLWSQSR
jgi:hypothetical protein